jgi:hypothetical protein
MDDTGCYHGTPWLVRSIGSELIAQAEQHPATTLAGMLRQAIATTADRHAGTCNLNVGSTPSAGVAALHEHDDHVEYLVLSDAFVVLDVDGGVQAHTDLRGQHVVSDLRAATFAHPIGSEAHARNRRAMVDLQRSYRNAPDGYWVAAGKPEAADHALAGKASRSHLRRAAVLSDGAAALVEYGLADWTGLLDILEQEGPGGLIGRVRDAEASDRDGTRWPRFKPSDDATAIFCTF